jgi:hypothetical protein
MIPVVVFSCPGEEVVRLQLGQLQAELSALQQELMVRGAAAAGAAAADGGSTWAAAVADTGSGMPLSLGEALRELGRWQRRAEEAEAQLDKVRGGSINLT